jgi:hypothetical protein
MPLTSGPGVERTLGEPEVVEVLSLVQEETPTATIPASSTAPRQFLRITSRTPEGLAEGWGQRKASTLAAAVDHHHVEALSSTGEPQRVSSEGPVRSRLLDS